MGGNVEGATCWENKGGPRECVDIRIESQQTRAREKSRRKKKVEREDEFASDNSDCFQEMGGGKKSARFRLRY